jgi:microcompartment protein CcmL/EutN
MKKYPALALLELSNIASGILTGDAMVKTAPVSVLKAGTVHNGKYLILIGGSVASVEEAYAKGLATGQDKVVDRVLLPDVHGSVIEAVTGKRLDCAEEALGVFETTTVAATIRSADAAVKGTRTRIVEIRLADDIGGKAFVIYNGKVEEVTEALEISRKTLDDPTVILNESLIPNLHSDMARQLQHSTYFSKNNLEKLEGGEL